MKDGEQIGSRSEQFRRRQARQANLGSELQYLAEIIQVIELQRSSTTILFYPLVIFSFLRSGASCCGLISRLHHPLVFLNKSPRTLSKVEHGGRSRSVGVPACFFL